MPSDCPIGLNMTCESGECCVPSGAVCALEGFILNHCCPGLTCTGTPQFSTCAPA